LLTSNIVFYGVLFVPFSSKFWVPISMYLEYICV
jgi:hypothetical protein